jgi:excisionase family DNA binding protein
LNNPKVERVGLTTAEAAQRLGVTRACVLRLIVDGRIQAARISRRGDYRVHVDEVDRFLSGQPR